MNYYRRHIGDYLKDTAHLTLLEHGIYARLLDVYYTREDGIPDAQAARLIGARTPDEIEALRAVLEEFFEPSDGGMWRQPRCEREIDAMRVKAERNREVGKRGGRPKTEHEPAEVTERKPTENPDGFHNETQAEPTENPSHKPIANSQYVSPNGDTDVGEVFEHWQRVMRSPRSRLDSKRRGLIRRALDSGYTVDDLCKAIRGCSMSPFHMGQNDRGTTYNGLDLVLRNAEKIDSFIAMADAPPALNRKLSPHEENARVIAELTGRSRHHAQPDPFTIDAFEQFPQLPGLAE